MPTRAHFRERHFAIGRKGAFETELLFAEDDDVSSLKDEKPKLTSLPGSPISVASALDIPSEIKPIALPGSWVVVGKGGKALKNEKMYDEPLKTRTAKKKKQRKRHRKAEASAEPEPLVVTLEETPSSSKCLQALGCSSTLRDKQMHRSKAAKYWASYQRAKQLQRSALDKLVAGLTREDELHEAPDQAEPSSQPMKDNKANSSKDKARRRARSAAAFTRCSLWRDDELSEGAPVERMLATEGDDARETRLKVEKKVCFASDEPATAELKLPGAWTTVGKRGKAVSGEPKDKADTTKCQATSADGAMGLKRRKSDEPTQTTANKVGKNVRKCSVM